MDARPADIKAIVTLQALDRDLISARTHFEGLPQRQQILQAREKLAALQEKELKVQRLKKDTSHKLTRLETEDGSLSKKEAAIQAAIDAASGDYRSLETRTKELNGIAKRRTVLAEDHERLSLELLKITELEDQLKKAIRDVASQEEQAVESFRQVGSRLKATILSLEAERDSIASQMDRQIFNLYDRTAARSGGVAITTLKGNKCGACRATIEQGRLIALKAEAPLGTCPSCKRIVLMVEDLDDLLEDEEI